MINGLDTEKMTETAVVFSENEALREVRVKAKSVWKEGGLSETHVCRGSDETSIKICSDIPPFAGAPDLSSSSGTACPTELILVALCSCLLMGISCNASMKNITINNLSMEAEGIFDIGGFLGMEVPRNGYEQLNLTFNVDADASESELKELLDYVKSTSPVYDIIINKLGNVDVTINTNGG